MERNSAFKLQIGQLATANLIDDAHNLTLVRDTGTGKTHLDIALGVAVEHQEKRVRFFNAVDLVNLLELEKQQDKTGVMVRKLIQMDTVILDELGISTIPKIRWCIAVSFNQPTL